MSIQDKRLLSIDALRGIAALMVVFYHSRSVAWVGMGEFVHLHHGWSWDPSVWLAWVTTPFRVGLIGVQLLFVLSGYCIHRNQAKQLANGVPVKLDLPRYGFRRFFRIYPTYVAALVVNGLILYALLPWLGGQGYAVPATENGGHSWYIFGMNLLALQNVIVPPYEGVFWSLSLEIHLYVAYIAALWVTRKYGAQRMMLVSLAAGVVHWVIGVALPGNQAVALFLSATGFTVYWFLWCAGAYVAEMQFGRAKPIRLPAIVWWGFGILGTGLLIGGITGFGNVKAALKWVDRLQPQEISQSFIGLAMAAFLWWSIKPVSQRVWTSRVGKMLAFVGTFSFSLYAIHVPVLATFAALWGGKGNMSPTDTQPYLGKPESILPSMLAVLCALVVAYAFFNVVERWTLNPPKGLMLTKAKPVVAVEPKVEAPVG